MSAPPTRLGWLDCGSGASGDMLLGALLGAGVPLAVVSAAVAALGVGVTVAAEPTTRAGLAATRAVVTATERDPPRRTLPDVLAQLDASALPGCVRDRARAVFDRLARAEARVHAVGVDEVHFHEVGALDALADVVGVCAAVEHLGLASLSASPVALGGGSVLAAHGRLPVPAPAVLALLAGIPAYGGGDDGELCTPTGAALLATLVDGGFGPLPPMRPVAVGVGAGRRDPVGRANVVRLVLGTPTEDPQPATAPPTTAPAAGAPATTALLFETNVDDLDPRLWPEVLVRLLAAGAADAWLTPILMKKGRPAHTLHVLAAPERAEAVRAVVFTETSTIGLRETTVEKRALDRSETVVTVDGQPIRVKLARLGDRVVNAGPEYDDVLAAARAVGRPLKAILAEAAALGQAALSVAALQRPDQVHDLGGTEAERRVADGKLDPLPPG